MAPAAAVRSRPAAAASRAADAATGSASAAVSGAQLGRIGPYELKAALAHDGLGLLYKAWDTTDRIEVMVTLLDLESEARDRELIVDRLQKSVLAAATLKHPGLARIHDAGVVGEGVYIVNDWLPGRTLGLALQSGWQPTARVAAAMVRDLARALAHAHAHGVLHGGLNPSTVMLDANDRPTVLGLGYASIAYASDLPSMDPLVRGAAPYLAPEQFQGGVADARTDVHALGVLLYEMLAGRRAYPGETVPEVARALMAHDPAPPHWLRLDVPERPSAIAMQALQRNPAARYTRCSEVADALNTWLVESEHEDDEARGAFVAAQRLAKPPRRKGYWVSASLLAAATAVGGFTWVERHEAAPAQAQSPVLEGVAVGEADEVSAAGAADTVQQSPTPNLPADAVAADVPPVAAAQAQLGPAPAPAAAAPAPAAVAIAAVANSSALLRNTAAGDTSARRRAAEQPEMTAAQATAKPQQPSPKATQREKSRAAPAQSPVPAAAVALQTGTVQLAVSPWGYVEVGGKLAGASPPLHKLTLPAGTHTITIRNEDFAPFVTTVQVTADKAATVRHRFAQ